MLTRPIAENEIVWMWTIRMTGVRGLPSTHATREANTIVRCRDAVGSGYIVTRSPKYLYHTKEEAEKALKESTLLEIQKLLRKLEIKQQTLERLDNART